MVNFEKVGECLYRYTLTGTYYGRFEVHGREVRRSLRTTDRPLMKRRLADLQRDLARVDISAGRSSLAGAGFLFAAQRNLSDGESKPCTKYQNGTKNMCFARSAN